MYVSNKSINDKFGYKIQKGDIFDANRLNPRYLDRLVKMGIVSLLESDLDVVIGITTYNRPECIYKLTKRLKQLKDVYIIVIDDASETKFNSKYVDWLIENPYNYGKQGYWKTVNKLWSASLEKNPKYFISLVDDLIPNDNFFDCIEMFEEINDTNKIAMDLGNYGREYNWTNFKRQSFNKDVFITQGTEQAFISRPDFINYRIPKVPKSRWVKNPLYGSGVGSAMNNYWVGRKRTIFGVKKSFFKQNDSCIESHMNPIERRNNPWIIL